MTATELISLLQELPWHQKEIPMLFMNEVWLHHVDTVAVETENEYGTQQVNIPHIRLSGPRLGEFEHVTP